MTYDAVQKQLTLSHEQGQSLNRRLGFRVLGLFVVLYLPVWMTTFVLRVEPKMWMRTLMPHRSGVIPSPGGVDPAVKVAEELLARHSSTYKGVDYVALDRFFAEQVHAHGFPGLAVGVVRDDEVIYLRAFGVDGKGQPLTPETQMHIASLSKSFTALAVMQLWEEGRVELDAPVQRYVPEFTLADENVAAQITVRDLLNQVSGLSEFGYFPQLPEDTDLTAAVADLRHAESTAQPGEEFAYFNPNYQLLGRLVEVVWGLEYDAYLQEHVLEPLGMERTFASNSQTEALAKAEDLSCGYLLPFRLPVAATERSPVLGPSGGLVSTAADLSRYLIMQLNQGRYEEAQVVTAESLSLMHTPPGGEEGYAMGWYVEDAGAPLHVVRHGGSLDTYAASMALLPDEGWGYVLLTNHNHALTSLLVLPAMERALVAYLTGEQLPPMPPATRSLGIAALIVAIVALGIDLFELARLSLWRSKAPWLPAFQRLFHLVAPWLPVLIFVLLPTLLKGVFDRAVNYGVLFRLAPGVVGWLVGSALLGVALGVGRLALWLRLGSRGRD